MTTSKEAMRAAIEGLINEWDTALENGRKTSEAFFIMDVRQAAINHRCDYADMYGANSIEVENVLRSINDDCAWSICGRRTL